MPKYVAFLRAINVGGHIVKMDQLRALFEALGFANVETFIASGNVIFDDKSKNAQALERKIETHLEKALGYKVAAFLRTTAELKSIANYLPFDKSELEAEGNDLFVAFAAQGASKEGKQRVLALRTPVNDFHFNEREVYWLRRRLMGDATYSGQALEKSVGMQVTVRSSTTVKKIVAKYS
jgi:uncharacterized protein (DUF1697 family)